VDGVWRAYSQIDAEIIDKEYSKSRTAKVSIQLSFNAGHRTVSILDFKRMLQINTETKVERMIRFGIFGSYHYSPHTRRAQLMKCATEFRQNPSLELLTMIRRLQVDQKHCTTVDLCKLGIQMFPAEGINYAQLAVNMNDENITLEHIGNVSKHRLLEIALELSPTDPLVYCLAANIEDNPEIRTSHERRCFELFGGWNRFHWCFGFALSGRTSKAEKIESLEKSIEFLSSFKHLFASTIHRDCVLIGKICSVGNYEKFFTKLLIDMIFELAALLNNVESVFINGSWQTKSSLIEHALSFGKPAVAHRIYLVKGIDAGRRAWYYVQVTGSIKVFLNAVQDEIIHLKEHGTIIISAYGGDAPTEATKRVMIDYGINADGDIFSDVDHLYGFLRHDQRVSNITAALNQLALAKLQDMENPFVVLPTDKDVESILREAKAKAVGTHVNGWTDGNVEPYISWKMAIVIYTMEAPCQLYRLINAPLNTKFKYSSALVHHHDFYRLLLTALSRWPYKHRGVVYRGITVGENEQLKRIVDSPEELLKEGTVLTFASFTSASTNKQDAERFATSPSVPLTSLSPQPPAGQPSPSVPPPSLSPQPPAEPPADQPSLSPQPAVPRTLLSPQPSIRQMPPSFLGHLLPPS
jgi:hypothetical protein